MNSKERSVEEIVEDIFGEDLIRSKKFENKIKKVIQTEREKRDEVVEEYKPAPVANLDMTTDGRLYALVEVPQADIEIYYKPLTHPNNK